MSETGHGAADGTELGREIRIGLVMYGGVSLAVYINGVAREFFEAVRGRGVYGLLKHLLDSDIVVDIISGASAGGINGVFLAYALANQSDFSKLAELWRDHADIDKLLRPISTRKPESLFQAESYYQEQLEAAFRKVRGSEGSASDAADLAVPSKTEAIDLFVVGTDYHGVRTFRSDALGHVLSAKNYRTVLRLRHRDGRSGSDLQLRSSASDPKTSDEEIENHHRALATACRITSAFPAALAPVHVPDPDRVRFWKKRKVAWASRVRTWGAIRRPSYFIDGGVLDNKPFSDAIERIFYRTAVRPVDRKIFYVEPDPEEFAQIDSVKKPSFTGVLTSSLLAIPRYESIAADLQEIDDRNRRLDQYRQIMKRVLSPPGPPAAPPGHQATAPRLASPAYLECRSRQFFESFREYVGETRRDAPPSALAETLAYVQAGRHLLDRAREAASARSISILLARHDLECSLRRLFFVSYQLRDALYDKREPSPEELTIGKNLRFALTRHIQVVKLLATVLDEFQRVHTDACIAEAKGDPGALIAAIQWRLDALFDVARRGEEVDLVPLLSPRLPPITGSFREWSDYLPDDSIRTVKAVLAGSPAGRCVALATMQRSPVPRVRTTILRHLQERADDLMAHFSGRDGPCAVAVDRWKSFCAIDEPLFPLEYLGGLREKDPIKTIRVSPRDAQLGFSKREARDKVAGDALGHFGGFLKKSWRSNDILWGRLDARCLLIQALLDRARLEAVFESGKREDIRQSLTQRGGLKATVAGFLPDARDDDRQRIAMWLDLLTSEDGTSRARALDDLDAGTGDGQSILEALVRAGQASILKTDLPDAAEEASGSRLESRTPEDLAVYFERKYRVGEEKPLEDISAHSLLRTASHTGLLARNALFASLFRGMTLQSSVLAPLKKVVGIPLWSTYWFATLGAMREIRVALAALSVLLLAVAIGWPVVLHGPGDPAGGVSKLWMTVFVVAPVGYLLFELLVMLMRLGRWAVLVLALLALAAGLWLMSNRRIELQWPITVSRHGQVAGGEVPSAMPHRCYRLRGRGRPNCSSRADRVLREMPSMRAARV